MKNCKKCGKEVGLFATYCNNCKMEIQEIEKQRQKDLKKAEQDKDEAIRKSTKDIVRQISNELLTKITDEPIISFTYIHHQILQYKTTDWSKLLIGIGIGGTAGEMLFGGSINSSLQYEGFFGIIILTNNKAIIKCIKSPFFSFDGEFVLDHVKLFNSKALNRQFSIEHEFNLEDSAISQNRFPDGFKNRIFNKSNEFVFNPSCLLILNQTFNIYDIADFNKKFYMARKKIVDELKVNEEKQEIERKDLLKNCIKDINEKISNLQQRFDSGSLSKNELEISLSPLQDKKEIIETYMKLSDDKKNELFFLMETIDINEVIVIEGNVIKEVAKEQWDKIKKTKAKNQFKLLYNKELQVDYA
jgi:hypothetical protein